MLKLKCDTIFFQQGLKLKSSPRGEISRVTMLFVKFTLKEAKTEKKHFFYKKNETLTNGDNQLRDSSPGFSIFRVLKALITKIITIFNQAIFQKVKHIFLYF